MFFGTILGAHDYVKVELDILLFMFLVIPMLIVEAFHLIDHLLTYSRYMLFRAGVPRHSIIKKFAGEDISRLEDFISVLSKLSKGARVPLEYISYLDRHRRKVT